ncbi:MAG TPA: ribonuclease J [Acidimicrobiia bacterium]|nr:ribonuclease J [Acidimicrobiia bacterium]
MSVRLSFLGGLGDIGRNCASLEVAGRLALIDCGLMFPEEHMLGVDLVLPDFASILSRADDLECVVLTHGHEDHVGALSYLLAEVNVPVYGTPLAVALASNRIEEAGIEADMRPIPTGTWTEHGPFKFMLVPVSHSIPQGAGIAFDTPEGIVVHSGDFKLDPTPIDGVPTDLPEFAALGRRGVRLLLSDSTNAEVPGFVPSEASLAQPLYEIVVETRGRVIAACFASHIHRVQQIVDAAVDAGRYVAFLGRTMLRNVPTAEALGLFSVPADRVLPVEELLTMPPGETAIVCTGSQGEPFAALSMMASGQHRWVQVGDGDTVLISARPIPGNEMKVSRVVNGLLRRGARVYHGNNANVHVSGHAAREELKTFINVVRPAALVPVHGEYRHMVAHAELAREMNVPDVLVCEDGDAVVLDGDRIIVERDAVPSAYVFVDGLEVAGSVQGIIRDRQHLSEDGVVVVTLVVDGHTGEIARGPDLESHGFMDDPSEVFTKARAAVLEEVTEVDLPVDAAALRRRVKGIVNRVTRAETGRRAVVLVVVLEV